MKTALLFAMTLLLLDRAPLRADETSDLVKDLVTIMKDQRQTDDARLTAIRQLENLRAVDQVPLADLVHALETVNPNSIAGQPDLATKLIAITARRGGAARAAIPALVRLKGKGNVDQQVERALEQILPPPDTSKEAIAALVRNLKDKDASIRLRAAKALGMKGSAARDAIPALKEAAKDADEDVRRVAAASILKIQGPKVDR
jgi:HEAT repeat protein